METLLQITAYRGLKYVRENNPWLVYFQEASGYFNSNNLAKILVSFTHACSVLFFYQLRKNMFIPLSCVLMSILYYEYDLFHHNGGTFKARLMRFHHKGSIIVLLLAYILEPTETLLSFYYLEYSNIPLYLTGLVVSYKLSEFHTFVCYVIEGIFFTVFRGLYFGWSVFFCKSWIIFFALCGIYIISLLWTIKIWILCYKKWQTLKTENLKNE